MKEPNLRASVLQGCCGIRRGKGGHLDRVIGVTGQGQ